MMFYFYMPKYDTLFGPFNTIEEARDFNEEKGGTARFYDRKPTEEEMKQEQIDYLKPTLLY